MTDLVLISVKVCVYPLVKFRGGGGCRRPSPGNMWPYDHRRRRQKLWPGRQKRASDRSCAWYKVHRSVSSLLPQHVRANMDCGIVISKTVLLFLSLVFWVSPPVVKLRPGQNRPCRHRKIVPIKFPPTEVPTRHCCASSFLTVMTLEQKHECRFHLNACFL